MDNNTQKNEICSIADNCSILEAEKELSIDSLKEHLSEQRHDFFNVLQVLYGYTQLKKPEKVLMHIKDYCSRMENIGRLYNGKCIKLADLLYTKSKEADSIDLNLEISADVSFDPAVRILDDEVVLYAVDHALSGFYYILDNKGYKGTHIMYHLKENTNAFQMEIYCKEIREGQLEPINFVFPEEAMYWKKIERDVRDFDIIAKYCNSRGFEVKVSEAGETFVLSICKGAI